MAFIPLRYNLRNLTVRKTTTFATGIGIALVVFVLATALMLSAGVRRTLGKSGRPDVAIVLRKGSNAELASGIDEPNVGLIFSAPGVARDRNGRAEGVGEVVVVLAIEKLGGEQGGVSNVLLRGVPDNVLSFRPSARFVAGRPARPGTDEAVVGARLRGRFRGLELGQTVEIRRNRPLTVVGVFEDGGSSFDSELWADLDTVRSAFGRQGGVSSVRVRLDAPRRFDAFRAAVEQDQRLGLEASREPDHYEKQSEGTSMMITGLGVGITVFFSIGAIIGAMITMYTAVANRKREVGVLRALGFSRLAILTAFLLESSALAVAGGLVGTAASLGMGFVTFSMINFASWSEVTFSFTPTAGILVWSVVAGAAMGLLGGFFPAVRASRVSPIEAMRG